ncbi:hypothetical protein, partial [[Eubacterium] cellulosolvens]
MARVSKGLVAFIIVITIVVAALGIWWYYIREDEGSGREPPPPPPPNTPPNVALNLLNGSNGRVNDVIWFEVNASDTDGQIIRYEWYFGDG